MKLNPTILLVVTGMMFLNLSCNKNSGNVSQTTGWQYNDAEYGGFETPPDYEQQTPPGMVFIEGGTFVMGRVVEDINYSWDNAQRRVTVPSFYMDQYEVSNQAYREYIHWLKLVYREMPGVIEKSLPDTLVWRKELAYNEPYLQYYFSHAAFSEYPVVGVNWEQANDYCRWRTDRVNEKVLVEAGLIEYPDFSMLKEGASSDEIETMIFTTDKYLKKTDFVPQEGRRPKEDAFGNPRKTNMSDGLLFPQYRLPTEAEWEYAAYGIMGEPGTETIHERRIYPWDGHQLRNGDKKHRGEMLANYARGNGDLMGLAGSLNDGYTVTAPIYSFVPNDFNLFNMAGNVNEWVYDVYRPTSSELVEEFNPFRGNVYKRPKKDENGEVVLDSLGRVAYELFPDSVNNGKYPRSDVRNYRDGDSRSAISNWRTKGNVDTETSKVYSGDQDIEGNLKDLSPRISNTTRVYKGGSWRDRPYWLNPATRRYLEQSESRDDLGFRCAMSRVGSSSLNQE